MANIQTATSDSSSKPGTGVTNVSKRLHKELRTLMMSSQPGISAFPQDNNIFKWVGTIEGGAGTVYEGLKYHLTISFPPNYPHEALQVKFETPCFHPNVDTHGNICLDILKDKWSALLDVRTVLLSIQSLLAEPNNESPLNGHAAGLWSDQVAYRKVLLDHYKTNVESKSENENTQMGKLS